ncbi:hypothetical protein PAPYR_9736 [Paratrimastix pyriformis]|uniref:Carbohydrate binding module family 25 domain-containing protein n=1 Tax=Paratrimastix pyriformis TaxID=342808 RepID=A0ABQ8UDC4_9EUKA|nr:hypothetical protein PAPYR_9736 [Paratrimastix pyriformis]
MVAQGGGLRADRSEARSPPTDGGENSAPFSSEWPLNRKRISPNPRGALARCNNGIMRASIVAVLLLATVASAATSIFYSTTSWSTVYLHYNADGKGWTPVPGIQMSKSANPKYPAPEWWFETTNAVNTLEFVLTDNQGHWDNNGGKNYKASHAGTYTLKNGVLTEIQTDCPAPGGVVCSGNGTCVSGSCQCNKGYWGYACDGMCPGGTAHPCSDRGTCTADGQCQCQTGFSTCDPTRPCATNTADDNKNCGACGKVCAVEPGVTYAVCGNSTCLRTCDTAHGWRSCPDGTCKQGSCPRPPLPGCDTFHENQCQVVRTVVVAYNSP